MADESFEIAIIIFYIFLAVYIVISLGILFYGLYSLVVKRTRIFEDKMLPPSDRSHRTLPRSSKGIHGSTAQLVGLVYIILGGLMLAPVVWFFFSR